jgi:hypothetical protein
LIRNIGKNKFVKNIYVIEIKPDFFAGDYHGHREHTAGRGL